jgi:hypothetical protein
MRKKLFTLAVALTMFSAAMAQPMSPDWKLYTFTATKKQVALFYLDSELVRTPPGHVQVWVKGLDYAKLDKTSSAISPQSELFKKSVDKLASGYVPSVLINTKFTQDQVVTFLTYELIADDASIPPLIRMLLEFDCKQRMFRQLSAIDEHSHTDSRVHEWEHIPPESTYETLGRIMCP